MSFLDRFQNKIATVTAHGHLKKADGSEEIRVGPPKRKPQQAAAAPAQPKALALPNNQSIAQVQVQPSARGRGGAVPPPLAHPAQPVGKQNFHQPQQQEKAAVNSARQKHPSPSTSPRSKTQRDAYDYDNNNYHQPHPSKGAVQYREPEHIPGRASYDEYGYQEKQHPQHQKGGYGGSPVKGRSPEKEYVKHQQQQQPPSHQQHYQQPQHQPHQAPTRTTNRSPVPTMYDYENECPSPRERNEARVHTDEDQLAFSRKARPVQFAPCTLSQYKKEKPSGYYELGKLQPDLNADELVQKRANLERIKSFSKNLRVINKSSTGSKKKETEAEVAAQKKANSTREKALAFAKHVPKPRLPQRPLGEPSGQLSATSSSDSLPTIRKSARPINSVVDDDTEDDDVSSELLQLQMRHQASRAQVEALIRNA